MLAYQRFQAVIIPSIMHIDYTLHIGGVDDCWATRLISRIIFKSRYRALRPQARQLARRKCRRGGAMSTQVSTVSSAKPGTYINVKLVKRKLSAMNDWRAPSTSSFSE